MTPNQITVLRVLAAFAAVALFGRGAGASLAAVGLTVAAIVLDAVDGWVARRKNLTTPLLSARSSIFSATAWSKTSTSHTSPCAG